MKKKKYITPSTNKVELNLNGSVLNNIGIDTNSYHNAEYSGEDITGDAKQVTWDDLADFYPWQDYETSTVRTE